MNEKELFPRHKPNRLVGYNYSQPGSYFITICVLNRACLLGKIENSQMQLSLQGTIVEQSWSWLKTQYPHIEIEPFCILPNHVHALFHIYPCPDCDGEETSPNKNNSEHMRLLKVQHPHTLSQMIAKYKYHTTRLINQHLKTAGKPFWQKSFYDHVVRDEKDLFAVENYIQHNVLKWEADHENPNYHR